MPNLETFTSIALITITIIFMIRYLILFGKIAIALAKRDAILVMKYCTHLSYSLSITIVAMTLNTLLEIYIENISAPTSPILIIVRLILTVGPLAMGGGVAIFLFRNEAKKMNQKDEK